MFQPFLVVAGDLQVVVAGTFQLFDDGAVAQFCAEELASNSTDSVVQRILADVAAAVVVGRAVVYSRDVVDSIGKIAVVDGVLVVFVSQIVSILCYFLEIV